MRFVDQTIGRIIPKQDYPMHIRQILEDMVPLRGNINAA